MNKFDKLCNAYYNYFSQTRFVRKMVSYAPVVLALIECWARIVAEVIFTTTGNYLKWITSRLEGEVKKQRLMSHFLNANWNVILEKNYYEAEKAKFGEGGFTLLNQVSVKSPFTYEQVRDRLPLIEPDWRKKSADELAAKLNELFIN